MRSRDSQARKLHCSCTDLLTVILWGEKLKIENTKIKVTTELWFDMKICSHPGIFSNLFS